jgi:hypothetical protein
MTAHKIHVTQLFFLVIFQGQLSEPTVTSFRQASAMSRESNA